MEKQQMVLLVNSAKAGDTNAKNELFMYFYDDVYYFALKTVKDSDIACDITQETFLEVIRTIGNLNEPAAFVTWLKRIAYHQCTRYFKKKHDVLVDEDEDGNTVFDKLEDEDINSLPAELYEKEDFRSIILSIINELSEEQRSAVLMYYFDEMSVSQIAQIQGVSEGTVKSRLNYARKAIKKAVEEYEEKNGIKLHAIAFFPLFRILYPQKQSMPTDKASAIRNTVTNAIANTQTGTVVASTATQVAATVATKTAGSVILKILSVLAIAAVAVTGVFVVTQHDEDPSILDEIVDWFTGDSVSSRDPEDVAQVFMESGFVDTDVNKVVNLLHPQSFEMYCKSKGTTTQEFEEEIGSKMDQMNKEMNAVLGTVEWKIKEVRDCTKSESESLKKFYKNLGAQVQDCQIADCELTVGVLGFGISDLQEDVGIVKIDGAWYLDIEEVNWIG